jgi:hypothetical protein
MRIRSVGRDGTALVGAARGPARHGARPSRGRAPPRSPARSSSGGCRTVLSCRKVVSHIPVDTTAKRGLIEPMTMAAEGGGPNPA